MRLDQCRIVCDNKIQDWLEKGFKIDMLAPFTISHQDFIDLIDNAFPPHTAAPNKGALSVFTKIKIGIKNINKEKERQRSHPQA